ncbi:hypothetical protein HYS94_01585 [Candidatus Daviesbacteria bacterium]|nr:hypothetical protein [Candidatus Daviesbacteria bacterium]
MANPPQWALDFTEKATLYYNELTGKDYRTPTIQWKKSKNEVTTGSAFTDKNLVIVRYGTYLHKFSKHKISLRVNHKLTLAHEIAHCFSPTHHHDSIFWRIAWDLYKWAKIPMWYAKWNEGWYKKKSLVVLKQMKAEAKSRKE